jgi:hypothetical protein
MAKTAQGIWAGILAMASALLLAAGARGADEWVGVGLWQGQIGTCR